MLWKFASVLLVLWAIGFALHILGGLIHLVLLVALTMFVIHLITSRREVA